MSVTANTSEPATVATDGRAARIGVLVAAVLTTGVTAGVFVDWSNAIMPGLGEVDDRTFVEAFRALDAAIVSPLFLGVGFLGSLLLIALSAVLHLRTDRRVGCSGSGQPSCAGC